MSTTPSPFESQLQIFSWPRSLKQFYIQLKIPSFTWIDMNSFQRKHNLQHRHFDSRSSKIYYVRDDPSTKKMLTSSFLCNYLLFSGCMYHSDQSKPKKMDKLDSSSISLPQFASCWVHMISHQRNNLDLHNLWSRATKYNQ